MLSSCPSSTLEQMRVVDDGVAESARLSDRLVERLARLHGEPIGIDHLGIYRSGCFVTTNGRGTVEQRISLGQRRCRISRAALAAEGADAAPLVSEVDCRTGAQCGRVLARSLGMEGPHATKRPGGSPGRFGSIVGRSPSFLGDDHLLGGPLAVHDELVDVDARGRLAAGALDLSVPEATKLPQGSLRLSAACPAPSDDRHGDQLRQDVVDVERTRRAPPSRQRTRCRRGCGCPD